MGRRTTHVPVGSAEQVRSVSVDRLGAVIRRGSTHLTHLDCTLRLRLAMRELDGCGRVRPRVLGLARQRTGRHPARPGRRGPRGRRAGRCRGAGGPREPSPLTVREMQVAELVAQGLSNPAIAARLYVSRPTVAGSATIDRHVSKAPAIESLAGPAAPASPEAQPGQAGHQVQLRGPDAAQRERVEPHALGREAQVALVDSVGRAIVSAHSRSRPGAERSGRYRSRAPVPAPPRRARRAGSPPQSRRRAARRRRWLPPADRSWSGDRGSWRRTARSHSNAVLRERATRSGPDSVKIPHLTSSGDDYDEERSTMAPPFPPDSAKGTDPGRGVPRRRGGPCTD